MPDHKGTSLCCHDSELWTHILTLGHWALNSINWHKSLLVEQWTLLTGCVALAGAGHASYCLHKLQCTLSQLSKCWHFPFGKQCSYNIFPQKGQYGMINKEKFCQKLGSLSDPPLQPDTFLPGISFFYEHVYTCTCTHFNCFNYHFLRAWYLRR